MEVLDIAEKWKKLQQQGKGQKWTEGSRLLSRAEILQRTGSKSENSPANSGHGSSEDADKPKTDGDKDTDAMRKFLLFSSLVVFAD